MLRPLFVVPDYCRCLSIEPSGSGKSSTWLAIFRGIDQILVSGNILIDGVDITTVPLAELRDSMRCVKKIPPCLASYDECYFNGVMQHCDAGPFHLA